MTVTSDELIAYAEGRLDGEATARVAAAIAADPALAAQIAKVRAGSHAANTHDDASAPADAAPVLDFAAAKARREQERKARARQKKAASEDALPTGRKGIPMFARPGLAAGLAASLVMGVMLGMSFNMGRPSNGGWETDASIVERGGQLLATGSLARGLDNQMASPQPDTNAPLRILASFRQQGDARYCRVYEGIGHAGIACHRGGAWVLERILATSGASASRNREAKSTQAELMATAQGMAAGKLLDAPAEQVAIKTEWRH